MRQLAVAPYATDATQLEHRLIYGKFILKKTGNTMTREAAMSAATLNRRLAQEIAELAVLLSRMAATTLDRGRSSPINTIVKVVSADIPTREDFVGRTAALAQGCPKR